MKQRVFTMRCLVACFWTVALFMGLSLTGCEAPGVGDPCLPEAVPEGGFRDTESYLETSSVQCRTRVCMVYKLEGDPRPVCEDDPNGTTAGCPAPGDLADPAEAEERIFCTCRCDGPSNTTNCECPSGFSCEEVLDLGGDGIRGSYCIPKSINTPAEG